MFHTTTKGKNNDLSAIPIDGADNGVGRCSVYSYDDN